MQEDDKLDILRKYLLDYPKAASPSRNSSDNSNQATNSSVHACSPVQGHIEQVMLTNFPSCSIHCSIFLTQVALESTLFNTLYSVQFSRTIRTTVCSTNGVCIAIEQ